MSINDIPLDIVINSIAIAGLLLVLYLYRISKKSTIATKDPKKKRTINTATFGGIQEDSEPSLKLRNPKDVPEPSDEFKNFELLDDMINDKQRKIIDNASSLKKPHPLLMSLTRDINDPKELMDIIKNDPELVVKVIKVANSSLFALRKSITTINHAIVYLGVLQAKNIAMQFALEHSAEFISQEQKRAYHRIWKASFLASSIGLLIAKDLKMDNSAELSTRCLLDYLGDISLLTAKPEIATFYLNNTSFFERVLNIQNILGTNASIMGKAFAKNAQLPEEIVESLGANTLPLVDKLKDSELSLEQQGVVAFSYIICRITDMIVFERTMDNVNIDEISYAETGCESFFHSEALVQHYGLGRINSTLRKAKFRQDVASIVDRLALNS